MLEAGYKFAVANRGRMRCVTFWRAAVLELVGLGGAASRDVITGFRWRVPTAKEQGGEEAATKEARARDAAVWVVNCHLPADKSNPGRQLQQLHACTEQLRKMRKAMGGPTGPDCDRDGRREAAPAPPARVIVCGDFNYDADAAHGDATGVDKLLREGVCPKGYKDPATGIKMCSKKARSQQFGNFEDAYEVAYSSNCSAGAGVGAAAGGGRDRLAHVTECTAVGDAAQNRTPRAPATFVAPPLYTILFDEKARSPTPTLVSALAAMFKKYADGSNADAEETMSAAAVDAWLMAINGRTNRGGEMRRAKKKMESHAAAAAAAAAGAAAAAPAGGPTLPAGMCPWKRPSSVAAADADVHSKGMVLTFGLFCDVYRETLTDGQPWAVAHDLWATHTEHGCLPPLPRTVGTPAGMDTAAATLATQELADQLGASFTARFDRIFYTGGLRLVAVSAPRSPAAEKANLPLPNMLSASDHLPIAAVFELG